MNKFKSFSIRILIVSGIWLACFSVTPVAFESCAQYNPLTLSQAATDQIILRAEQTAEAADLSFNTFVHLERDNEALLLKVNPNIHTWADNIRQYGQNWVRAVRNATKAFKDNRNATNQATLNTALATLNVMASQTNIYIAQAKKVSQP